MWWVVHAALAGSSPTGEATVHWKYREGTLAGLTVYLSAGHGMRLHERRGHLLSWDYQRPLVNGLREDLWTADFVNDHLIPILEARGAIVHTARERDRNPQSVVIDDADIGFSARGRGTWSMAPGAISGGAVVLAPFSEAVWKAKAPASGSWQVYVRWSSAADRDHHAQYTVMGPRGGQRVAVDQRTHGAQWYPLTALQLDAGGEVTVQLVGSGAGTLSADAVRIGGGSFTVTDPETGEWQTVPAWKVSAVHEMRRRGVPAEVWTHDGAPDGSDARVRGKWASWAHPAGEESVYLSIHSDGGGGTGTTAFAGISRDPPHTRPARESLLLADLVRTEVVKAARTLEPGWIDRGTKWQRFSEISPLYNGEMPSTLIEVGFHDTVADADWLARASFADRVAWGVADGLVRFRGRNAPGDPMAATR